MSVLGNGQLLLNGKPTDLQTLDSEFKSLKAKQGAIWYYRENPETDPPPAATEVIKLVIRYRLPIRLSKKPDFSDDADENERSQRKP